jgi:hypothetical protein
MQAHDQHGRQRPQFLEPWKAPLGVCGNYERSRALERPLIIHDVGSRESKFDASRLIASCFRTCYSSVESLIVNRESGLVKTEDG